MLEHCPGAVRCSSDLRYAQTGRPFLSGARRSRKELRPTIWTYRGRLASSSESYLDVLPSRLTFPLTRACTGFNARRASWAVEPESFDAATAELAIVSRTSFD